MSTTTESQDQLVTVPLNPVLLQNLFMLQVAMSQKQGQGQAQGQAQKTIQAQTSSTSLTSLNQKKDSQPKGQLQAQNTPKSPQIQTRPLNNHQNKPQNIQNKPQTLQSKPMISQNTQGKPVGTQPKTFFPQNKSNNVQSFNLKKEETVKIEQVQIDQGQQNSNAGGNTQGQAQALAILAQLQQLGQASGNGNLIGNLLAQISGNAGNKGATNELNKGNNNDGEGKSFKYSSLPNNNQNQMNGRNRPFQNRGGNNFNRQDNNGDNGNFRNNRGSQFGQGGRGGRGGSRGGRGGRGGFNSFGENRGRPNFNNENRDDFSKSRSRDKSVLRQRPFGNNNGDDMDSKQGGGARPQNPRKGDWQCPNTECNNINFAIRNQCNRCGLDKPEEIIQMEQERRSNAPVFKKGDWNCLNCKNLNFARRNTCNRCNAERPEETYEEYKPSKARNQNQDFGHEDGDQNNNYEEGEMNEEGEIQGNFGENEVEEGEVGGW